MSDCSYEPRRPHPVVVQCTRFTHVTTLLWAFLAGRCDVFLLLAVLHSIMGIVVFLVYCYGFSACYGRA